MLINAHQIRERTVDILLPVVVGFICGAEAIIIRTVIPLTFGWILSLAGIDQIFTIPILFAFLLFGAFITGLLTAKMRDVSGFGLDVAIRSYHSNAGLIPAKFPPLKFLATFFTLGFGGSGGLVGPTAAIGQGTASYFSRWLKLSEDKSRIIALCGVAGCVSGLLNTPFGAAVFALEVCYMGSIVYEDFIPVLLSSISAYIMSARITPMLPYSDLLQRPHLFRTAVSVSAFPWSLDYLLYCIIAAMATTFVTIVFIKTFRMFDWFNKTKINRKYSMVIGALFVGLVTIAFFRSRPADVMGQAGDLVETCAMDGYSLKEASSLLAGRWVTTFLTVGTGGSGGLFAPIVLMGGLSGTIVARLLRLSRIRALIATGIATALVGAVNVPIAAVIIVVEAFGVDYIMPAAIGSAVAFLLAKNWVIYPNIRQGTAK